jgi:hypothetical protein
MEGNGCVRGQDAVAVCPYFWVTVVLNFVVPFMLLGIRRLITIRTATIAAGSVVVGMWLERFVIRH